MLAEQSRGGSSPPLRTIENKAVRFKERPGNRVALFVLDLILDLMILRAAVRHSGPHRTARAQLDAQHNHSVRSFAPVTIEVVFNRSDTPMPQLQFPCNCCGFRTLLSPESGSYEICPVCFWEDDPVQAEDLSFAGGANAVSLAEDRENYLQSGACEFRSPTR